MRGFYDKLIVVVFALLPCLCAAASTHIQIPMAQQQRSECFRDMTFAAINCNSLNLSSANKPSQLRKIYAIAKMQCDVIFLSDIRLSKKRTSGCIADLKNNFLTNPYESYSLYYNSSMNKRGVGILLKCGLHFSEIDRKADPGENYLAILIENTEGKKMIVVSIYGPNTHNQQFFTALCADVASLGDYPVIKAGDWNCTYDTAPVAANIDCFNMADVPNLRHSMYVNELCENLNLADPLRFLRPDAREFSYVSKNAARQTRSRIDFFLVSNDSLACVNNCTIDVTRLTKAFDHNTIST